MQKSITSSSAFFCGVAFSGASASRAMSPKWRARLTDRVGHRAVPAHQPLRLAERRVVGLAVLDRALPEGAFLGGAPPVAEDYRQRHLALAEIVADILA